MWSIPERRTVVASIPSGVFRREARLLVLVILPEQMFGLIPEYLGVDPFIAHQFPKVRHFTHICPNFLRVGSQIIPAGQLVPIHKRCTRDHCRPSPTARQTGRRTGLSVEVSVRECSPTRS